MTRYRPTLGEQAATDLLRLAGYAVVRQATYDGLHERVRRAEQTAEMEVERRKDADDWARQECREQRRLADRLNDVVAGAMSQGVTIQAINDALHPAPASPENEGSGDE